MSEDAIADTDQKQGMSAAITSDTKQKALKFGYLLAILPPFIYWVYWILNPSIWFNADPATTYFLDSLSVFTGNSYTFVDHPGTPLHLIGSFLLALTYPFLGGQEAFINFHLARPGVFFFLTNTFLLSVNILCALVFYKTALSTLKQDRLLAGVALAIFYFCLHRYSFPSLTFWSHNSFNFPIGALWLLWLYNELNKDQPPAPNKLLLLGFAAGVYAIAQIYFSIWLFSGIFTVFIFALRQSGLLRAAFRSGIYMSMGGALGMISMLLPIYKELPQFVTWLTDNITHQGLYGSGEEGIYTLAMIPASISYWWLTIRPLMLTLLLTLLALGIFAAWYRRSMTKLSPGLFSMLLGLLALTAMILFVMSKVLLRLRFSLSLAAVLPVLILVVLRLLEFTPWNITIFKRLFYATCIAGTLFALAQQIGLQQRKAEAEREAPLAKDQAVTRLARELRIPEEDVRVVYAFAVPLKCPSLLMASIWQGSFEKEINALCPNQNVILDVAEGLDADFHTARPIPEIEDLEWDLVVWPGNGSRLPEYLESVGATIIPDSWPVRRNKWFYIHSEVLED